MNQVSYATNLKHNSSNSDKLTNHFQPCKISIDKDENIGNHGYIGNSILKIYRIYRRYFWIYRRYIGGYYW